jgi:hypothetical protein
MGICLARPVPSAMVAAREVVSSSSATEESMIDWLHALPVGWIVFVVTALVAGAIYWLVMAPRPGSGRAHSRRSRPACCPPGIIFGLLVVFMAAQVWGDFDRATAAVNREASALRAVDWEKHSQRPASAGRVRQDVSAVFRNASAAGRGGGTPWTHASGDAVSLPGVFSARMPRIAGCRHRGPGSAPAPARSAFPVTRTNAPGSPPAARRRSTASGRGVERRGAAR